MEFIATRGITKKLFEEMQKDEADQRVTLAGASSRHDPVYLSEYLFEESRGMHYQQKCFVFRIIIMSLVIGVTRTVSLGHCCSEA